MLHLTPEQRVFVMERHLATLTTLRADGTPHVVPVAFTWDADKGVARITTKRSSVKARNARGYSGQPPRVALCQVDGGRWITIEGTSTVIEDTEVIADAVKRYAVRYRPLEADPERIVIEVKADNAMSSVYMAR
ncbi:PPOX class F420-dependent oxidoreductase [Timonella senegalensis]|jgi:PPOX class probable F420-dependent enzyme|uniref:pyridoxamine 5'-phosphate oxidase family protein n=1 Tax=Timonella senegalensis TaxID=1465825 RepID=UPI0028A6064D|nr:PPOX class F420-dependent oxidoreductase [Timonella senegalensis]